MVRAQFVRLRRHCLAGSDDDPPRQAEHVQSKLQSASIVNVLQTPYNAPQQTTSLVQTTTAAFKNTENKALTKFWIPEFGRYSASRIQG